ncbi:hypothetical protein CNY89_11150 [Amaricoccus sp. HAR-UPW-R2A-40]|nr:hypothetical protein CNY89_11150 [Amaricoccus sp. HAR-UPW-R2A-40]
MAGRVNHDYHILPPSIWPFTGAVGAFVMLLGAVLFFHDSGPWVMLMGLMLVLYTMYSWWADVISESQAGQRAARDQAAADRSAPGRFGLAALATRGSRRLRLRFRLGGLGGLGGFGPAALAGLRTFLRLRRPIGFRGFRRLFRAGGLARVGGVGRGSRQVRHADVHRGDQGESRRRDRDAPEKPHDKTPLPQPEYGWSPRQSSRA